MTSNGRARRRLAEEAGRTELVSRPRVAWLESLNWRPLEPGKARDLLGQLLSVADAHALLGVEVEARLAALPFYEHWSLVHMRATRRLPPGETRDVYALMHPDREPRLLAGKSDPIHEINEDEGLRLDSDTAPEYVRFFLFALRAEGEPFVLYEEPPSDPVPELAQAAALARPLRAAGTDDRGRMLFEAVVIFMGNIATTIFSLADDGEIEMVDDTQVLADVPESLVPGAPRFEDAAVLHATLIPEIVAGVAVEPAGKTTHTRATRMPGKARTGGRPAISEMVEILLDAALAAQSRNRLIEHFNARTSTAGSSIDRFAALVASASPVVVVETSIPFAEEAIARVILERLPADQRPPVHEAQVQVVQGDEQPMEFRLPSGGPAIVLIPFQVHERVALVERLAFDIATRDLSAIIACVRFEHLPEALRRHADIVLRLPTLDEDTFERLFERVMGVPAPDDWRAGSMRWVKHLLHTDFEHPRRMGLAPAEALAYVRAQVEERLVTVDPVEGMSLKDLHGMGEARQFAEDLIADIHAAVAGRLAWTQVDRGALLVGPPGTGKTTLAKAIAKDCGVRFIHASAAGWQAEGTSLGPHISAIRRTFREAREYAPSILFIDEIDSLGSREQFAGTNNALYQTEVVNAVLEQMGGLDPSAPVFVIGATNHEDQVDPALRRSGRLDRVIRIPRPNSEALRHIYRHYLGQLGLQPSGRRDIDLKVLAGMSVGLTGADVERVVRGAARRARKADRAIAQKDLLAEITNKPRGEGGHIRLTTAELERIAVHEAGHALTAYLGPAKGADIGFVTVVPREDGTLGFMAPLADERAVRTRPEFEARIDVCLGGRAAEELRYGADLVSSGSHNDLEMATSLARDMVTRLGMGGRRKLAWTADPTDEDRSEMEAVLDHSYQRVLTDLRKHHARLDALVTALIGHQELSGREVRALLAGRRGPRRAESAATSRTLEGG
jgi:AAA+ superfamily predicted ATPase